MVNGIRLRNGLTNAMLPEGIGFELKFEPTIAIQAAGLRRFYREVGDLKVPLRNAARTVVRPSIRLNFEVGGRPPWEPLSEYTIDQKKGNSRPLIRTGHLRDVASSWQIWTFTENSATIRSLPSSAWYGNVHQKGHRKMGAGAKSTGTYGIGYVNIPARPFITLQKSDEEKIVKIFERRMAFVAKKTLNGVTI